MLGVSFGWVWIRCVLLLLLSVARVSLHGQADAPRGNYDLFRAKVGIPAVTGEKLFHVAQEGWVGHGTLVMFGAPWCKHSRQFNVTFQALARRSYTAQLRYPVGLVYYEVLDPKQDAVHKYFRVRGFPTVVYLWKGMYWSFDGQRNLQDLEDWLQEIWTDDWREGEPIPKCEPTLSDDMMSIIRDIKFFFKYHMKARPFELLIGAACVAGSFIAVLGILGIIIYDAVILGWNKEEESTSRKSKSKMEELEDDEEGRIIKESISEETAARLANTEAQMVVIEELRTKNPRRYKEYQELKEIERVLMSEDKPILQDDEMDSNHTDSEPDARDRGKID